MPRGWTVLGLGVAGWGAVAACAYVITQTAFWLASIPLFG